MLLDSVFLQHSILGSALQASAYRNQVISNNIANADTPNFKKSTVLFEDTLDRALARKERTGGWDFSGVKLRAEKLNTDYEYRLDGNNVDMEAEMTALYENAARYDALTAGITNNSKRFALVLQGRN